MAVNPIHNVKRALEGFPVSRQICWSDSTVALHWIRGEGRYKQFVGNRAHENVTWRHVSTEENPADLESRGGIVSQESSSATADRQGKQVVQRMCPIQSQSLCSTTARRVADRQHPRVGSVRSRGSGFCWSTEVSEEKEAKTYIIVYACSLSCNLHLEPV